MEGTPSSHREEETHGVPDTGLDAWIIQKGRKTKMPELVSMRDRKTDYKRWRGKLHEVLSVNKCDIH